MSCGKKETHEIERFGGTLKVEISYTPRVGGPVRMHHLKFKVLSAEGCSPNVFVFHRAKQAAPMEDGSPRDEFLCVADELDEDEIPVNEPDMARHIPYYRVSELELLFRNSDLMYETAHSVIRSLRQVR